MKLRAYCKHCKKKSKIDSSGILLRGDFEDKHGSSLKFSCDHCSNNNDVAVNRVFAVDTKTPLLICLLVSALFMGWSAYIYSSNRVLVLWPLYIGAFILSAGLLFGNNANAKAFNKSFV